VRHELISDPVKLLVKHPSLRRQRKRVRHQIGLANKNVEVALKFSDIRKAKNF